MLRSWKQNVKMESYGTTKHCAIVVAQVFVLCLVVFTPGAYLQESYDLETTDDILMQLNDGNEKQNDIAALGQYDNEGVGRLTLNETASDDKERLDSTVVVAKEHGGDGAEGQLETEDTHDDMKQPGDLLLEEQDIDGDSEQYLAEVTSEKLENSEGQKQQGQNDIQKLSPSATFKREFIFVLMMDLCFKD